jgi:hypothetical protein
MVATPENTRIALEILKEILPPLVDIMRERLIVQTLAIGLLSQKLDQLITREIHSGFSAIEDATSTVNEETRQIRLRFAEEQLLKNTHLDSNLQTGGRKNNYWMAHSHHGLMNICLIRGDDKIAHKHLLSIFECDPRLARTILAPEIWEKVFQPECKNIYDWFEKEQEEIKASKYAGQVALEKTLAVGKFAGKTALVAAAWFLNNGKPGGYVPSSTMQIGGQQAISEAQKQLSGDWENATPEEYQRIAVGKLKMELESKIDWECRRYAIQLISAM